MHLGRTPNLFMYSFDQRVSLAETKWGTSAVHGFVTKQRLGKKQKKNAPSTCSPSPYKSKAKMAKVMPRHSHHTVKRPLYSEGF